MMGFEDGIGSIYSPEWKFCYRIGTNGTVWDDRGCTSDRSLAVRT